MAELVLFVLLSAPLDTVRCDIWERMTGAPLKLATVSTRPEAGRGGAFTFIHDVEAVEPSLDSGFWLGLNAELSVDLTRDWVTCVVRAGGDDLGAFIRPYHAPVGRVSRRPRVTDGGRDGE